MSILFYFVNAVAVVVSISHLAQVYHRHRGEE